MKQNYAKHTSDGLFLLSQIVTIDKIMFVEYFAVRRSVLQFGLVVIHCTLDWF